MLWHDDFFTNQKGETFPYWKIANVRDRFIIQHPYIQFGTYVFPWVWKEKKRRNLPAEEKTPVYFQKFELSKPEREVFNIPEFLVRVEKNAYLEPNETLWHETGYWSIILQDANYMGMGVDQLMKAANKSRDAKFAVCFSNGMSILLIKSEGLGQGVTVTVYSSNELIPFAEVVEPYRKTVAEYEGGHVVKSDMLWEEDLLRFWFASHELCINPIAYIMDKEDPKYKRHPVIRNEFTRTKDALISKIDFMTGTTSGGFIDSDYDAGHLFELHAEIWDLENVSVVEFIFDQTHEFHRVTK